MLYRAYYQDWSPAGVRRERDAMGLVKAGRATFVAVTDVPPAQSGLIADAGAAQIMGLVPEMVLHITEQPTAPEAALRHARESDAYGRARDRLARRLSLEQISDSSDHLALFARCGRPQAAALR